MRRIRAFSLVLFIGVPFLHSICEAQTREDAATIDVSLAKEIGLMIPVWAWFGYDEPNYTYMKDGKKLLNELSAMSSVPVHVRCHNLLTSGDGTPGLKWGSTNAYTEDANGNPIYNWQIVDSIFDTYVQRKMKPLVEIGFMPEAMSSHPQPYKHEWRPGPGSKLFTGWAYPPKDYKKWGNLAYEWVKHCVQRYGKSEVESWYWEVWNEPNIGYWQGSVQEFCKLYDYAAEGVKRALPTAVIGGSNVTGGGEEFQTAFIKHCLKETNYATGKIGSPLEILLFHAKGSPKIVNGHVTMDMGHQLRNIDSGFKLISSYPEIKNLPVVIGESDPEGCAACGMTTNKENAYRNGTMYSSYTAASFARKYAMADHYKINFQGAVSWSFEFENQPWFFGFRDLATNGIDKPVLNVFRMFGMMTGVRVEVTGSQMYSWEKARDASIRDIVTDIGGFATKDKSFAAVMLWNYHDDDTTGNAGSVTLTIHAIPAKKVRLTRYQIDDQHSNSYEVWKSMGSPQYPSTEQIATLEKAGQLAKLSNETPMGVKNGELSISMALPRKAVALITLSWHK